MVLYIGGILIQTKYNLSSLFYQNLKVSQFQMYWDLCLGNLSHYTFSFNLHR